MATNATNSGDHQLKVPTTGAEIADSLEAATDATPDLVPTDNDVVHTGGCHCGAVQFVVMAPPVLQAVDCNCSICFKKQNRHFIVPKAKFKLLQGEDNLTCYTFNTHQAKHLFCKTCGVQSFYSPRSNPDGYGVMPHCLDQVTVERVVVETFDGQNWEQTIQTSSLPARSKVTQGTGDTKEPEKPDQ
ncbi:centromere protein V-like [Branchiostoma floridae x Branchiostoma japonicum]